MLKYLQLNTVFYYTFFSPFALKYLMHWFKSIFCYNYNIFTSLFNTNISYRGLFVAFCQIIILKLVFSVWVSLMLQLPVFRSHIFFSFGLNRALISSMACLMFCPKRNESWGQKGKRPSKIRNRFRSLIY